MGTRMNKREKKAGDNLSATKASESPHFISLTKVDKFYQSGKIETRALENVNFTIEEGDFVIVVGPSGAGKTTILNIMGGLDAPTAGEVIIDHRDIATYSPRELSLYRRNTTGFVFQFYNLVPNLTAMENVELATEICADSLDPAEVLRSVGLAERLNNFPAQLSGGEQQRVAIARALAKNPRLLLCDEPTGALDDDTGRHVLEILQTQSRENGMTVVVITHNTALIPLGNKVIHVKNGTVGDISINDSPTAASDIAW